MPINHTTTGEIRSSVNIFASSRRDKPQYFLDVVKVRKNIREDMEDKWVTNLNEDRKRFYVVSSQLDPLTKMLSFCDNKYFVSCRSSSA